MTEIPKTENQRNIMGGILIIAAVVFGYFWYATAPMDAIGPMTTEAPAD